MTFSGLISSPASFMNAPNKIVVSNGYHKFHLAFAAEQLEAAGRLGSLLTGIYPTSTIKRLLSISGLQSRAGPKRLLDREVKVSPDRIWTCLVGELAEHAGAITRASGRLETTDRLASWGLRHYSDQAARALPRLAQDSRVYHYRAGFGGPSVQVARRQGLFALCDHSIAHPLVLTPLSRGDSEIGRDRRDDLSRFWRVVLDDIEAADAVLVNSDFVKETFALANARTDNVRVIYLGIDDEFANAIPPGELISSRTSGSEAVADIVFAGGFSERKGAHEVIEALSSIPRGSWRFTIAGTVDPATSKLAGDFLARPDVSCTGWLTRPALAKRMAEADIFLFPSRAEGSARVVFEALASGCFIVTTKNTGSIVEDGVHGTIVPYKSPAAIARAVEAAIRDLAGTRRIGRDNAALIRARYMQSDYGGALLQLYDELAAADTPGSPLPG